MTCFLKHLFVVFIAIIANVDGFSHSFQTKIINRNKITMMNMNDIDYNFVSKYSVLLSKIETSQTVPDGYVYGQVNAPGWVLPGIHHYFFIYYYYFTYIL